MLKLINDPEVIEAVREKIFYYLDEAKKTADKISGAERQNGLLEVCDYLSVSVEKN